MAGPYYVNDAKANDDDDGSTWALAKKNILGVNGALALCVSGDTIYTHTGHAENYTAGMSFSAVSSTQELPITIIVSDDTGNEPPQTYGGAVSGAVTTSGGDGNHITMGVYLVTHGLKILPSGNLSVGKYTLKMFDGHTGAAKGYPSGNRGILCSGDSGEGSVELYNTDVEFETNGKFQNQVGSTVIWRGGSLIGNPTFVFDNLYRGCHVEIEDVGLATKTSGQLIDTSTDRGRLDFQFNRCKLADGVTLFDAVDHGIDGRLHLNQFQRYEHRRGIVATYTSIYRDSDRSLAMVSNADANFGDPLRVRLASRYIDTDDYTTNITFTVHFARDDSSATLFTDAEIGIEVEHMDGADPDDLGVLVTTKSEILATPLNITNEAGGWTGLAGDEGTDHEVMSVAVTITIGGSAGNIATGPVTIWACLWATDQEAFVCPKVDIT